MDENLVPFKDQFYKECNAINFSINLFEEIHTQIKFYEYICEKDFEISSEKTEYGLKKIKDLKKKLKDYKNEPSNVNLILSRLIKFLYVYYSSFNKNNSDFLSSLKKNMEKIKKDIKNTKKNILQHCISMLKQTLQTNKRNDLNKYMVETLELVMKNVFKNFFNFYQVILIFSKKKNDFYQNIKLKTEQIIKDEEINIIINEMSERSYAQSNKIYFDSLHFGNDTYKELLITDENYDVMDLSNSYLNYTYIFINCIKIRKNQLKELRIYYDKIHKKESEEISNLKEICGQITSTTKNLSYSSQGIINSWNLIFSSWNSLLRNSENYLQFLEEILNQKLLKIINECNEEYKAFEKRWEKYSSKIKDFQEKYSEFLKEDIKPENLSEKNKVEEQFKNYLSIDCTDFLDNNIPLLRESEIKRGNDFKDLIEKIICNIRNKFEQHLENSEKEYDNAASIELFEELKNIFESQFESYEIENLDEFLISLKEKIQNIDFNDKLADKARLSLAEFYDHNDFDDGSDLSPVETENPFGPAIKDNEENTINLNEEKMSNFYESKNMINSRKLKGIEDDISSIPLNEKHHDMITLNAQNINTINISNKTPSFNKEKKENNINVKNFEENDLSSGLNIINNLNDKFNEKINKKVDKIKDIKINGILSNDFQEKIEANIKNENEESNLINKYSEEKEKDNKENNKNIKEQNLGKYDKLKDKQNIIDKSKISNNKKESIKVLENQTTYYGILGILGLFCLKSLFSSNSIFSVDTFLNLFILGIICFVFYKTQLL